MMVAVAVAVVMMMVAVAVVMMTVAVLVHFRDHCFCNLTVVHMQKERLRSGPYLICCCCC